jgi:hypothetical protein
MRPVEFKQANKNLLPPSKVDVPCKSLPVFSNGRQCVSCWQLTLLERVKILFTGKIWLGVLGKTQPPLYLEVTIPFLETKTKKSLFKKYYETEEK